MMPPAVEVRDLRFHYHDGVQALDGVSLEVCGGESVALLGPNGSGKTTFLLHLNGLLQGSGLVRICGVPVEKRTLPEIRQKVGIVFQEADEQLFMPTVREDVAFGPLNLGWPAGEVDRRVAEALEHAGLAGMEKRAPYHLSAGEKRRVALAGVLAMSPQILVLDEPTTSLDPPGRADFLRLLLSLPHTRLIATHDLEFARRLCTRAVFFDRGRLVANGPVSEVISKMRWDSSF